MALVVINSGQKNTYPQGVPHHPRSSAREFLRASCDGESEAGAAEPHEKIARFTRAAPGGRVVDASIVRRRIVPKLSRP